MVSRRVADTIRACRYTQVLIQLIRPHQPDPFSDKTGACSSANSRLNSWPDRHGSSFAFAPADFDDFHFSHLNPTDQKIVVALGSQARSGDLLFLEAMTPSERHHYFQAIRVQNTQDINVTRRPFRRWF